MTGGASRSSSGRDATGLAHDAVGRARSGATPSDRIRRLGRGTAWPGLLPTGVQGSTVAETSPAASDPCGASLTDVARSALVISAHLGPL
jgi:hypothetical protein